MSSARTIRWGVIGAGGVADRRTIPEGIIPSATGSLAMIMDVDADTVARLSRKYGVPGTTDLDELVQSPEIDAVYIATPHFLHASQIIKAASAGKHVLSEKPMAANSAEAAQVLRAVESANVKFALAYLFRYHAVHAQMKELIDQGAIGRPVAGRAQLSCWYPRMEDAWRQVPEQGLGGAVVDMASHCMDLLEFFLGRTAELTAFVSTLVHEYPVDDMATILQKFRSGAHGIVDVYWNVPDRACENRLEMYGTKGSLTAAGTISQSAHGEFVLIRSDQSGYEARQERSAPCEVKKCRPEPVSTYMREIDAFARAITADEQTDFPPEQALWNLKLCEACYRSAETGRSVRLSP